jgi:uncharacterized protein (DUF305 family)
VLGAVLVLALAGCEHPAGAAGHSPVDVMFAQMSLVQIGEGDRVAAIAAARAGAPEIRTVAVGLRAQWRDESGTMRRWLADWKQPAGPDPDASAHAGHGDLHALRPADLAELNAATGAGFDRTAIGLLLGNLHNSVQTTRMESAGGRYPPAINLAGTMTERRQAAIRTQLRRAARGGQTAAE